jgi:outer membrane biosynthesis protein TonB
MTQKQIEPHRTAEYHDRRYRRFWRWALLASALLHILVILAFQSAVLIPPSPFSAAGPRAGDDRAAAGGGTQVVALRIEPQVQPQPVVEAVVPVPVPVPEPEPEIKVEEPPTPVVKTVTSAVEAIGTVGEGKGKETGAGIQGGTGKGDGGNSEAGLFRVVPPSPRGLILPPSDRPGRVRGKEVDVWVFVTARGQVVSDSTRLDPTTGDRKFDDRLKRQAAEWVFDPARRGGQAIAEWFRYTIIL